ncbi:MAG: hypothetical protein ACLR1T_09205 [Evtepia gabavorous]
MDHALSPLYTQLAALAAKHGAQKLVLFGSRARETIPSAAIST